MRVWLTCCWILLAPLTTAAFASSDDLTSARAEILPLFEAMQAAANAHDAETHLSFYVREPTLLFVINDRAIVGWDALLEAQRQWWRYGKTDVVYRLVGEPDFRMTAPGLVMVTYFLTSQRTLPDGRSGSTRFGISALWQRRPQGWRIIYAHESAVQAEGLMRPTAAEPQDAGRVRETDMTHDDARTFAEDWAAAWNERDVERVLSHFDENVSFTSPTARAVMGAATVRGKPALREYWNTALARVESLRFTVDRVSWDAATRELAIVYDSEINGRRRRVSENLIFGPNGLVVRAEVFHGVEG